ncbi:aldehyde dehydrogenase family protein [Alkalicoccobacillus porphyridii]|uniref:aldehyde dehydrogenase family protein n=1 Tax=Alkalicoccobacillus porphyridii TaxID=2597270 RepID=UPI0027BA7E00|nr:aldehyde dehydrogenase family protein [Alkalicoccobacillus porphyridii]
MRFISTTYGNYIHGSWVDSESGNLFASTNPANTEEVLGHFQDSTVSDTQKAIDAAESAFPSWSAQSAIHRADILYRLIPLLAEEKNRLATIITNEVGKTFIAAQKEVEASIQALKHFSGAANRLAGETVPANDPATFTYTVQEPLGAVGVITPFNFPLGIGIYKIAPAMLAGNTVVYKPPNDTALIAVELVKLFDRAGMPAGVLNMVTGAGEVVGKEMGGNHKLKAISFTGSTAVGMELGRAVHARGGKMQAEMGGKNATIILEDADLEAAIDGIILSGMFNNGQSCTGTSRVIVPKNMTQEVTERLVQKANSLRIGNGFEDVDNGAVANEKQLNTYLHFIESAKRDGAVIECGGRRLTDHGRDQGYFVAPTVISGVTSAMEVAQEEIFGPVVAVIEVDSFDEAIDVANDVRFGLSSAIYTKDLYKAHTFVRRIQTGVTHVNVPSNHYENQLPFGGKKNSSIGPREQGSTALDFWLETKAVYLRP